MQLSRQFPAPTPEQGHEHVMHTPNWLGYEHEEHPGMTFRPDSAYGAAAAQAQGAERKARMTRTYQPPITGMEALGRVPNLPDEEYDKVLSHGFGVYHNLPRMGSVHIERMPHPNRDGDLAFMAVENSRGNMLNEIVGHLDMNARTGEAHMDVHPEYRGKGIGTGLLHVATQTAQETPGAPRPTPPMALTHNSAAMISHMLQPAQHQPREEVAGQRRLF